MGPIRLLAALLALIVAGWAVGPAGSAVPAGCNNRSAMKPQTPSVPMKTPEKPDMKSGLPGTPEERRRNIRAAMKEHSETLRRLAQ